jgi:hypothetical protein
MLKRNNRVGSRLIPQAAGHGKERKEGRDDASKITSKFNRGLSPITPYYPLTTIYVALSLAVINALGISMIR